MLLLCASDRRCCKRRVLDRGSSVDRATYLKSIPETEPA
jgi:hypothetical protein